MSWVDVNVLLNLLRKKKFMLIQICNPYTISWLSLTNLLRQIPWILSFLNFITCCKLAVCTWKLMQLQICGCGVEELRGCGFNNLETSLRTCGNGLKFWTSNSDLRLRTKKEMKWDCRIANCGLKENKLRCRVLSTTLSFDFVSKSFVMLDHHNLKTDWP